MMYDTVQITPDGKGGWVVGFSQQHGDRVAKSTLAKRSANFQPHPTRSIL